MEIIDKQTLQVWDAAIDFDQDLKFSYEKERTLPNGTKAHYVFSRRAAIGYVGIRENLHKFQLGITKAEFSLTCMAEPTADLSKDLHIALGLLVLGADRYGNLVEIYNLPYIQHWWAELKKDFLQDYDQEPYLGLIHEMDARIANEQVLLAYLQLPTMYGLYFNGYWLLNKNEETIQTKHIRFGKEVDETDVEETIVVDVDTNELQQQISIHSSLVISDTTNATVAIQDYKGACIYVDGILDTCKKEIQIDSTKFYYSAKWVGLKKLFQYQLGK